MASEFNRKLSVTHLANELDDIHRSPSTHPNIFLPQFDESPEWYRSSLNEIANISCTDLSGRIVYANKLFCHVNKCSVLDIIGKTNNIFNSGCHPPDFFEQMWKTITAGNVWRGEICNRAMDGSLYWVDATIAPRIDGKGRVCGYISLRIDISARKKAEAEAIEENRKRSEAEALLKDIVDTLPNGVIAYDPTGKIIFFNKASLEICGEVAPAIKNGNNRNDIIELYNSYIKTTAEDYNVVDIDNIYDLTSKIHNINSQKWIDIQNRRSPSGTLISVQTDVTSLKNAENIIRDNSLRDSLTGLYNLGALIGVIKDICNISNCANNTCTLVAIDLDYFKSINDGMGHDAGDKLLCHVANALRLAVRKTDIVARIGGDEFAILLPDIHKEVDIKGIMEKLKTALTRPTLIDHQAVIASASMGVATYPLNGKSPEELIKCADSAMYRCKRDGGNGYSVYDNSMRQERARREFLISELRKALAQDGFGVVLQPQQKMSCQGHIGFEALVRWKVGRRSIAPEDLISIAEEAGLITQLSYQIIDKALAMIARLKRSGLEPGIIGINVVAAQLHEPDFVKRLTTMLEKHGISPPEVEIEVTENVILDRSAKNIARVLKKLHATGMSIALDDFGMGYASLTHLKQFPLNRLKIDRSFISGVMEDKDDHAIVCAIISLAHNLGLQVVAEGVETQEQFQEISRLGCDLAQGYLIGRPMDEHAANTYLRGCIETPVETSR